MNTKTQDRPTGQQSPEQNGSQVTAKKQHPAVEFRAHMESRMSELVHALPPHISPDRFTRVALTAVQRVPQLLQCTKQSLWNACLLAAQDGLLPDGREGAIVPYGQNDKGKKVAEIATWMPMIEGLRKKARNSGELSNWEAHVVYARDAFEVILGDTPRIDHKPYVGPEERGAIVAAYSIAWLKDGTISREVMTKRELDQIKAKSKAASGPWSDAAFVPEMYRKTVARRHYKSLPHSSDLDAMIKRDDEAFGIADRSEEQIANRQQGRIASTAAAFDQFAGAGTVIEHEEPTGTQDDPPSSDETLGEFDDAPTEKATGSASASGDAEGGDAASGSASPAEGAAAPTAGGQPTAATTTATATADTKPTWPADKVPKTSEEYEQYSEWKISTLDDGSAIASWFKGEVKLRNDCGVMKDTYDRIRQKATDRVNALNAKKA